MRWSDRRARFPGCASRLCGFLLAACARMPAADERPLLAGWAVADITPPEPVNLVGQYEKRISTSVRDPLTATALALETPGDPAGGDQAILVSCDLIGIQKAVAERVREALRPRIPDFDPRKLILNGTHTHTGPGLIETTYEPYDLSGEPNVMRPSEYAEFFIARVAAAAAEAWQNRRPAGMSWALGYASVGTNRRAVYFDGTAKMYGRTNVEEFSHIEGSRDDAVEMLFFFDERRAPTGIAINIASPSQETEGLREVSADFWHETREEIRRRLGPDVRVLAQCAAAGDQSPHLLVRSRAEEIMAKRRGLTRRQEIARRIANAVDDALPVAKADIRTSLAFRHEVALVDLPEREPPKRPFYETDPVHPVEIHVLRLGEVALATNPFELYIDYGVRMKARSKAVLTLIVQLACMDCGYLPTERAVRGGGYSAEAFVVGPEGGRKLVDETVRILQALFP